MTSGKSLTYIHKPIPSVAGFTIPVFGHRRQFLRTKIKGYVQKSRNGIIADFEPVELSDDQTLVKPNVNVVAYIGGEEYISFFTKDFKDIIGTRGHIIEHLKKYVHQYTNPYVLLDIAEFIEDRALEGEALASIDRLRADIDPLSDPPIGNTTLRKRAIGRDAPGSLQKRYAPVQSPATQAAYARDGAMQMSTQAWVLVGIFCAVVVTMIGFALVGLPTKPGTPGSAFPPTINGQ